MDLNSNKVLIKNSNISITDDIFVEFNTDKFIVYKNDIVYTTLYPKTVFENLTLSWNDKNYIHIQTDINDNKKCYLRLFENKYVFLNGIEFNYDDFVKVLKDDISKKYNINYNVDTIASLKNKKIYTISYFNNNISYYGYCGICDFAGKIYENYFGYVDGKEMLKDFEYNENLKHNMNLIYNEDVL